jgi:hypothetical protein
MGKRRIQEAFAKAPQNVNGAWTMTCFTHEEAVYAYTQRRPPYWRSYKKIAKELGKSERSTVRAIGRIALERRTYGPSWTRMRLEHKREEGSCH